MKIDLTRSRLEKDFESFIKGITTLAPEDFLGLCKVLCVEIYLKEDEVFLELLDRYRAAFHLDGLKCGAEESRQKKVNRAKQMAKIIASNQRMRPMEDIINDAMNSFLKLDKQKRREVLGVLKDYKRGL